MEEVIIVSASSPQGVHSTWVKEEKIRPRSKVADLAWRIFANVVTVGLYSVYNNRRFEAAVCRRDATEIHMRWTWGAQINKRALNIVAAMGSEATAALDFCSSPKRVADGTRDRLFEEARRQGNGFVTHYLTQRAHAIGTTEEELIDQWLVKGKARPELTPQQWAFGSAAAVFRLQQSELSAETLTKAVENLKQLDRDIFDHKPEDPYRPELRHAIRVLKTQRDAALFEPRDEDEKYLHQLALRAVWHADVVIRYSSNAKYRNLRPKPFTKEKPPVKRWLEICEQMYNYREPTFYGVSDLAEHMSALGRGNCPDFSAVAARWLREEEPKISARLYGIKEGDHIFFRANYRDHSLLVDPWALKTYRWEDRGEKLRNYKGQTDPREANSAIEAKPQLEKLQPKMRIVASWWA